MRVEADAIVPFPRLRTFLAYRDEMPAFVRFLPNVKRIVVEERDETPDEVRLRNVWHGGGEVPAAFRAFISEDVLSWTDHARWREGDWLCTWRLETHALREAVRCEGTTRFVELSGDRTRVEIRGELAIDLARVPGIPSFLAGSLGRKVEQFLVKQITPNLTGVTDALTRHLNEAG